MCHTGIHFRGAHSSGVWTHELSHRISNAEVL